MDKEHHKKWLYNLLLRDRCLDLKVHLGKSGKREKNPSIDLKKIRLLERLFPKNDTKRLFHFACDLYLKDCVTPLQSILDKWMSGAKAQVCGEDIPFFKIISWCQEQDKKLKRDLLEKEAQALCRFLAPFSHSTWQATLRVVKEDLKKGTYLEFVRAKRAPFFDNYLEFSREFLEASDTLYFELVPLWLMSLKEPIPLEEASRYDAIYLLGMRYVDNLFPKKFNGNKGITSLLDKFFKRFLDISQLRIHVKMGKSQSYCIPLEIPQRVHVLIGDLRGWLDLEGLFHELGHAIFFANNQKTQDPIYKDFYQSYALCEAFAFLFQMVSMEPLFLERVLGIEDEVANALSCLHKLKFFTLSRRYGAKFVIEYENFARDFISRGQENYASLMKRYTGFRYGEETYLFDLMPDFYSLDYFLAFLAAFQMEAYLKAAYGKDWFFKDKASSFIKAICKEGNRLHLEAFLEKYFSFNLSFEEILSHPHLKNFLNLYVKKMAQSV